MELTKDKELRAPSFIRLRPDKLPRDCTFDSITPAAPG